MQSSLEQPMEGASLEAEPDVGVEMVAVTPMWAVDAVRENVALDHFPCCADRLSPARRS